MSHNDRSAGRPRGKRGLAVAVFGWSVLALCFGGSVGAQIPAGTDILNQAAAVYVAGVAAENSVSNIVRTRVLPFVDIRLAPPGTIAAPAFSFVAAAGDTSACTFSVNNLGNDADSVSVSWRLMPSSTTPVSSVVLFRDANGNGRFDTGEDDPAFLALSMGGATALDVAVVLPAISAPGNAFVEVQTRSTSDTTDVDLSVIRVTSVGGAASTLHIGPAGNARALPGGETSPDDVTGGVFGYADITYVFDNDILNEAAAVDVVELRLPGNVTLPPGVLVQFVDTTGTAFPQSPSGGTSALVGAIQPAQTRRVRTVISTSGSTPLYQLLRSPLPVTLEARSLVDTSRVNSTLDRLSPPQVVNPGAAIVLEQAFREAVVSVGDVATLVVTVRNITDSLRVDAVSVRESVPGELNFAGSGDFSWSGSGIVWTVGSLNGGESRTAVVKFSTNSRVSSGRTRVGGVAAGLAETGEGVVSPPVTSALKIENDVFAAEGIILGDVFVDENGNGRRDRAEAGVAGAAVYLESGEFAVTDSAGTFSIARVFAGRRVIRLDVQALAGDLEFNAPRERVVHLLPSGNARVAFALSRKPVPTMTIAQSIRAQENVSIHKQERLYQAFTLPSSYFAMGKAELMMVAAVELQPIAMFLYAHPDWNVLLEGHTDSIPIHTERYPSNEELSVARANAVRDFLALRDIDSRRIVAIGYGERRPVATNATVEGRRFNRRVDVSFVPPGVQFSQDGQFSRVNTTVTNLYELPDTFVVRVRWEVATTSPDTLSGRVLFSFPSEFQNPSVVVRSGDTVVESRDGVFPVGAFTRSHGLEVSASFRACAADTALVTRLAATLELDSSYTLSPRGSGNASRTFDLDAWTVTVPVSDPSSVTNAALDVLPEEPADLGADRTIVEPSDGTVFSRRDAIDVRARVPLGSRNMLRVDGIVVEDGSIGRRVIDVRRGYEEISWYGVRIQPGWNHLSIEVTRIDGSTLQDTIRVALSGRPESIVAKQVRWLIPADGLEHADVRFDVRDGFGLAVADGVAVTVIQGAAALAAVDARPSEAGLQVLTRDGSIVLPTRARNDAGRDNVEVEYDGLRASSEIAFVRPEKPFFATGIVDVKLGAYNAGGTGNATGVDNHTDGFDADAESRLFLQGPLAPGVSLTARLDTRKRYDDPLLKQDDPEREYPIFGDASHVYHAAPARGGNYVSIDHGQSFLRYGDFRTPLSVGEFLAYNRATTGATTFLSDDKRAFRAFVARTDFATHQDEIRADGTSGFFYLSVKPVVENSERVVVETRDRFQSESVLRAQPMVRNRDYTINPFDGSILFKEPLAAYDPGFNPVTIVITYEVETGAEGQYLYGLRGDIRADDRRRAGIVAVANGDDYALYGVDGEVRTAGVVLGGELARSDDAIVGEGNAYRVTASVSGEPGGVEFYHRRVDGTFHNPSFRGAGSELATLKTGFQAALHMTQQAAIRTDGYTQEIHRTGETRQNARALASLRRGLYFVEGGVRVARQGRGDADSTGVLGLFGVAVGGETTAGVGVHWEKNLGEEVVDDYPDRVRVLAAMPLSDRARAVTSYEYLTAPSRSGSHQLSAGVEGRLGRGTTAYTKYSLDRIANDDRMGAVSGVRQQFSLGAHTSVTAGVEALASLSGDGNEEYTSVKTGLNHRVSGEWFVEGQYEYRWQRSNRRNMLRLNAAQQLSRGTGWLVKNTLSFADVENNRDELGYHGAVAGAWRPVGAPVQSLAMVRSDYERFTPVDAAAINWRLVLSGDVNILPSAEYEVRLKYAFKHVENFSYGESVTTDADLLLGQYIYRFAPYWDSDLWASVINQRHGGAAQGSAGLEIGRMFFRSLRVAAGYSFNGVSDPDFMGSDAWSSGFGVRIQLILSDWILSDFERIYD